MDAVPSTTAGVITATATVITALGGLVLAFSVLIPILRNSKEAKAAAIEARDTAAQASSKTDEVHKIVNQQRTDMIRYTEALIRTLRAAGIEVPIDQSIPEPEVKEI